MSPDFDGFKCECLKDQCKDGCITGGKDIRAFIWEGQPKWYCRQCSPAARFAILKEDLSGPRF